MINVATRRQGRNTFDLLTRRSGFYQLYARRRVLKFNYLFEDNISLVMWFDRHFILGVAWRTKFRFHVEIFFFLLTNGQMFFLAKDIFWFHLNNSICHFRFHKRLLAISSYSGNHHGFYPLAFQLMVSNRCLPVCRVFFNPVLNHSESN